MNDLAMMAGVLVSNIRKPSFPGALRRTLNALADIDSMVVLSYGPERGPHILHEALHWRERETFYGRYIQGAYRVSPFFRASRTCTEPGFYRIADAPFRAKAETGYWETYYRPAGIVDLASYLVPAAAGDTLMISFGRVEITDAMTEEEASRFRDFMPVIAAATERHWSLSHPAGNAVDLPAAFQESRLQDRIALLLTPREREVASLVLKGHSSKSAARLLGISPATERLHRHRVYAKLEVSGHLDLCSRYYGDAN